MKAKHKFIISSVVLLIVIIIGVIIALVTTTEPPNLALENSFSSFTLQLPLTLNIKSVELSDKEFGDDMYGTYIYCTLLPEIDNVIYAWKKQYLSNSDRYKFIVILKTDDTFKVAVKVLYTNKTLVTVFSSVTNFDSITDPSTITEYNSLIEDYSNQTALISIEGSDYADIDSYTINNDIYAVGQSSTTTIIDDVIFNDTSCQAFGELKSDNQFFVYKQDDEDSDDDVRYDTLFQIHGCMTQWCDAASWCTGFNMTTDYEYTGGSETKAIQGSFTDSNTPDSIVSTNNNYYKKP